MTGMGRHRQRGAEEQAVPTSMTPLTTTFLDDLAAAVQGDVLSDDLSRAMYSTAAGIYQILPLGVVRPRSCDDILTTLRFCRENETTVVVRGSGTSPVDGCLGRGIVIDMSAYMGSEAEIDVHEDTVTAPAGVSCARLNEVLAHFGRTLPIDPPGRAYRTVGGMVATNAAGISSAKYGTVIDHVESLELVLSDGSVVRTRPIDVRTNGFNDPPAEAGRAAELCGAIYQLLRDHRGLIHAKMPPLPVNSSGYRLDRALWRNMLDLARLITGSEGTLAIITRATLRTVSPLPVSGALVFYFENVQLAADSVRPILDAEPRSIELVDARALGLVRSSRPDLAHFCRENVQSALIVEFDGADNDEIIPRLLATQKLIVEEGGTAVDSILATAEPDVDEVRALRDCVQNHLQDLRGPGRVTPFMEDLAVPPDMLSSCVHGLGEILRKRGLDAVISGHVGHGGLCAQPLLDLKNPGDVRKLRETAEEVFAMVVDMGGTISGGHGDGLARTEFLRLQYGELCDVFAEVKRLFDPGPGLLNPGVKVGGERGTIVSNLRYGEGYARRPIQPKLLYPDEPRGDVIERCHGCGACRSFAEVGAMCPVYRALRTEEASPRAKANILRHLLSNQGTLPPEDEVVADLTRLTDLCLGCRMCSVECPSGIDVSKLMIELRARRAEKAGLSRDEKVMKRWNSILIALATFPGLGNLLVRNRTVRFLADRFLGVAAKRELGGFRVLELSRRHRPTLTKVRERAVYFTGTHADCHDPELLRCTLDVLLRNGVEVEVMSGMDSGETRLTYGDVAGARRRIEKHLKRLAPLVAEGVRVVFTDPRTTLFFRKGMLDCIDTPEARAVAAASFDLMQFLLSLHRAGRLDTRFRAVPIPLGYHAPCHLRALRIGTPSVELLGLVPELPLAELGGGCCGMSGTFGLRSKNYEVSMQIGRPLFEHLRTLDVRYGLSECPTCAMQLHQGSGKRVLHPVQVLHRAYGLSEYSMQSW